jgi:hypothetical protein
LKRFNTFLGEHNLFSNHQFGFRSGHAASHQQNRRIGHIKTNRKSQESTGMVFHKMPFCLLLYTTSSQPIGPRAICNTMVFYLLQRHFETFFTYFKQRKININASKTQAIYFTRCWDSKKLPITPIIIGDHPIPMFHGSESP